MYSELIDNVVALKAFVDGLVGYLDQPASLYIDLEGNNLSRNGTLSIVTVFVEPRQRVYLIDVTSLGREAFMVAGFHGHSLKDVLEWRRMKKVFFDIRNDSDALFSLYGINVNGIEDIQLMELATRSFSKRCVHGLAKCIESDSTIGFSEKREWRQIKDRGRRLFAPERGGSFAVFDQRPLSPEIQEYCTQDVALMPDLRRVFRAKLCDAWWRKIEEETQARIVLSKTPTYNGKGRHMAEGPRGWLQWRPAPAEVGLRSLPDLLV